MHSLSTQVLIVGAGPAGLATAIGLAERGVDFVIVDALAEAQNTSRAAVIHAATLDSLRALSLSDRLVAQGIEVPQFRIRERDAVLFDASFAGLPTPTPFALMIPQDETERIFIDRLAELGHAVRRPVRLTRLNASAAGAPLSRERYRVVAQLADAPPAPTLADVQRLMDSGGRVAACGCARCCGDPGSRCTTSWPIACTRARCCWLAMPRMCTARRAGRA